MDQRFRPNRLYHDFEPNCAWTEDGPNRTLRVDIPGFKKECLKVQIDSGGDLKVSGERPLQPLAENRWSRFRKVFRVPQNSNITQIKAKFENGVLFVLVPKAKAESGQGTQGHDVNDDTTSSKTVKEKEDRKGKQDSDTTTTEDHDGEEEEEEEEEEDDDDDELPSLPRRDNRSSSIGIGRRISERFRSSGWEKLGFGSTQEKGRRTMLVVGVVAVLVGVGVGVGFYLKQRGIINK